MRIIFLTLCLIQIGCITKYPFDRYQKLYGGRIDMFKKESLKTLKIGKSTRDEVFKEFGDGYDNKLTFSPLLPRKYKGKWYEVASLLHYGYAGGVREKTKFYTTFEARENIQVAMFFNENDILEFYYINHDGGNKEFHNLDKDDDQYPLWSGISCDFKYYESVSNTWIKWRLGSNLKENDNSLVCEWEEKVGFKK